MERKSRNRRGYVAPPDKQATTYLAGPMRNRTVAELRRFDLAAQRLRDLGWAVLSPLDHERSTGATLRMIANPKRMPTNSIDWDVNCIMRLRPGIDVLHVLPDWHRSVGVNGEIGLARWVGVDVSFIPREALND